MQLQRPATWDDVRYVVDNMREGDVDECEAIGLSALDALSRSYADATVAYTLLTPKQQRPAAILGVGESVLGPQFGSIWMLGTEDIGKHKVTFLRNCKPFLSQLYELTGKECFYNYTYAENKLHHAWLKWLGFTFLREVALPPYGSSFIEFVRLKG